MHLARRLGATKRCPRKPRQAQVDRRGVQRINRVRPIQTEVFPRIQGTRLGDHPLDKGGIDPPVSAFVGIGQHGTFHRQANTSVVQLGRLRRQTGLDVAQAFAIRQLCKGHDTKVFGARQRPTPVSAAIAGDDSREGHPGQTIQQLRKQGLADIQGESSGKDPGGRSPNSGPAFQSTLPKFAKTFKIFIPLDRNAAPLTGQ